MTPKHPLARSILLALLIGASTAQAQSYPDKPIRIIVPFAAGGLVDGSIRTLAPKLSEVIGQPVVIDNRGGAGGIIGTAEATRANADGYTLLYGSDGTALAHHIYKNAGYDPVKDLQAITQLLSVPIAILVHPSLPVKTLQELANYSKANPGKLSASSGGQGTSTHLCLEAFKLMSGADFVHISYKGAGPALTDFLAGQTQVFAVSTSLSSPHIRAGKAIGLAVAAPRRASNLPDVPTTAEAGFAGIEYTTWTGLFAPTGTSPAVITRIRDAAVASLNEPTNVKRFGELGLDRIGTTPEEFRKFVATETTKFGQAVRSAGIKAE